MKYTVLEKIYPNESETKLRRRNKICIKIIKNFDYSQLAEINYLKIANQLDIDRRTLYNYFENRDDFLICIALCILEDLFRLKDNHIRDLKKKQFESNEDYLFTLLYSASKTINLYKTDSILFFKRFDSIFYDLPIDRPAHKSYTIGNQYILTKYNALDKELYRLIDEQIIMCPIDIPANDLIYLIRESIFGIQKRLLYMKHLPHDNSHDLLKSYIRITAKQYINPNIKV